ncbi:hypothetical protein DKT69_29460 [Micromonospora sicca]|uniref:Uncharacterized protein n=1 Tax=Micromonospora sicca TaxID=2202420 RepID=A0A317D6V0_9ACTN|nr:hypothetical protein [Micromonospora sp. 4G51]PWR10317.1 hypothetical protein DKT69_29460 [Micromonospora sp. 4G51]
MSRSRIAPVGPSTCGPRPTDQAWSTATSSNPSSRRRAWNGQLRARLDEERPVEALPVGPVGVGRPQGHVPQPLLQQRDVRLVETQVPPQRVEVEAAQLQQEAVELLEHQPLRALVVLGVVPAQAEAPDGVQVAEEVPPRRPADLVDREPRLVGGRPLPEQEGHQHALVQQRPEGVPLRPTVDEVLVDDRIVEEVGPVDDHLLGVEQRPQILGPGVLPATPLDILVGQPADQHVFQQVPGDPLVVQALGDDADPGQVPVVDPHQAVGAGKLRCHHAPRESTMDDRVSRLVSATASWFR